MYDTLLFHMINMNKLRFSAKRKGIPTYGEVANLMSCVHRLRTSCHVCTPSRRWTVGARSLTKTPSPTPPSLKPPASLGIARPSRALTHRQSGQTTMSASATHLKSAWHASHITEAKLPRLMAFQVSSLPRRNSTKGMKKEQKVKRELVRFMQTDIL